MPQAVLNPTADARLISAAAEANFGSAVRIGWGFAIANFSVHRSCLRFDLSAYIGNTAQDSTLLFVWAAQSFAQTANLHALTQLAWAEGTGGDGGAPAPNDGCSWRRYDSTTDWTSLGGDFNATVLASGSASAGGNLSITVPAAVLQDVLDNQSGIANWLIKASVESGDSTLQLYHSREAASNKPTLTFNYEVPATGHGKLLSTARNRLVQAA